MSDREFLADVEPLTHRDRLRRAVDLGARAAAGDALALAALGILRKSPEAYDRALAIVTVHGSRGGAHLVEAVGDASRTVRRAACRLVAVVGSDDEVRAALDRIVERRVLRRTAAYLARRQRIAPLEAFLVARMERGPEPLIVDLLPLGSEAFVTRFRRDIEQMGGDACWLRLAARHPALAARWFLEDLLRAGSLDPRRRYRLWPCLETFARLAPDATLPLIRALFAVGEEPATLSVPLARLLRARPAEVFDLIKARHESGRPARPPGAFGAVRFDSVAHELGAERLRYLVRSAWASLGDGRQGVRWFLRLGDEDRKAVLGAFLSGGRGGWGAFLFRYLDARAADDAPLREQAFERWSRAAQGSDGTIPVDVLAFLPRDLREREARRHLNDCPAIASKPERRLPYARLLGFAEAKEVLGPFLGHPEGEERARAQSVLISTVYFDRGAIGAALANVQARKFEQDPVRRAMISALCDLPVARCASTHLGAVSTILQDAIDAADLSATTASAVERWVVRLFPLDGPWGAGWIAKLLAVRGVVSTYGLGQQITHSQAEGLAPALETLARAWATRERAGAIISLATSLGIRLAVVTPLLEALERLARQLPFVHVAAAALTLLSQHDRPRFARLAPELLKEDRSFVLLPSVARHVSLARQDLLPELLTSGPMTGRFATGRTHWVIAFEVGFGRWTASQQRTYAKGLCALLEDPERDVPTLSFAIATLVRLPFADATPILPYASDPRPPVREKALRGLPWLDSRQGVPVLIEALGDARARIAIYALRKVFSEMTRSEVLATLRAVPTTKVTVAKEVTRLYGEIGGADAYAELLRLDRPGIHRDIRIALLRALWDFLDQPQTWEIFERAVSDPDWIVASKLADIPLGRLSDDAEARVVALLSRILGRPEPEARLDLLKRAAGLPLRDGARQLFQRLLDHLAADSLDEAVLALMAVSHRMLPGETDVVSARLAALIPRRRHLVAFVPAIRSRLGPYAQDRWVKVAEGLLLALRSDPLATHLYLTLGAGLWAWKDLVAVLVDLGGRDLLYHDVMVAAVDAVRCSVHPDLIDAALQKGDDARLRRLGLEALVNAAGPKEGWTRDRRERLALYLRDPAPGVAGPASFVFPP